MKTTLSLGAAFGVSMMNRRPDVMGHYLCFSAIGFGADQMVWKPGICYPEITMNCGDEEGEYFANEARTTADALTRIGVKNDYYHYKGGHNRSYWQQELAKQLTFVLPPI